MAFTVKKDMNIARDYEEMKSMGCTDEQIYNALKDKYAAVGGGYVDNVSHGALQVSPGITQSGMINHPLPDWALAPAIDYFGHRFSPLGMLYIRCQNLIRTPVIRNGERAGPGKFAVGPIGIFEAHKCKHEGIDKMALFVMVRDEAMIIYDDVNLFPSDSLLTKLVTLRDCVERDPL